MKKKIAWWWWFRFAASGVAIVTYFQLVNPQGFAATWLGGIGVGVGVGLSLDACRAGYRREQRRRSGDGV